MLKKLGALLPEETLRYAELVLAGDVGRDLRRRPYLTVSVYPTDPSEPHPPPQPSDRDVVLAACVAQAYEATAGLEEAREKGVSFASKFAAWGTDDDGDRGHAGAAGWASLFPLRSGGKRVHLS